MSYDGLQRGATVFSRTLTLLGSAILMVCVVLLTVSWWREGRWIWVVLGIAIIVVNLVLLVVRFRLRQNAPAALRPRSDDDGEGADSDR